MHKILRRYRCPALAWTDPATGVRIKWARKKACSYVHEMPGDLVHVDIKKLGRIPDRGGRRFLGRADGKRDRRRVLATCQRLPATAEVVVKRVLTDNGPCYRSKLFAQALGEDIKHKRIRPYRPQPNGKVERSTAP